jgi:hypothetical protein
MFVKKVLIMIKYLEKEFTQNGNKFKRVASGYGWYIYKVAIPTAEDPQKYSVHYEYFPQKFRQNPWKEDEIYEKYPTDEAFGYWAFCTISLQYAINDIKRRLYKNTKKQ